MSTQKEPAEKLTRIGCIRIGEKEFVLAAKQDEKADNPEKRIYYLFDESESDLLGNPAARLVRHEELRITDVVQLIGLLFTSLEGQLESRLAFMALRAGCEDPGNAPVFGSPADLERYLAEQSTTQDERKSTDE